MPVGIRVEVRSCILLAGLGFAEDQAQEALMWRSQKYQSCFPSSST